MVDRHTGTLVLTVALVCVAVAPAGLAAQMDFAGEHGLRVTDADGRLGVAWLTSGVGQGLLRVLVGDSVLLEERTPAAGQHRVDLPRPGRDVEIQYGAADDSVLATTRLRLGPLPPTESGELTGVDSLYVVGDVHGEYDRLRRLLANAGLVDHAGHWTGGRRHVVFLGDIFDRGPDVNRTLWFMYRLEREARAAGGGAHAVIGNHETMIFTNDLRYVSPKEQLLARLHGVSYTEMFDIRTTVLGKWLAGRPGLMRIDGLLLAHGGVVPEIQPHSVPALNDSLRAFMAEDLFYHWADTTMALVTDSITAAEVEGQYERIILMDPEAVARRQGLIFDERSILWYRGYVQTDTLSAALDRVLDNFDAEAHIVGHTPVPAVGLSYGGRLMAVDLEDPAREMLLLVRQEGGGHRPFRARLEGPPEALR